MRTTTLRSSISSFGPFCSNGSEPRSFGENKIAEVVKKYSITAVLWIFLELDLAGLADERDEC